MSGRLAQFTVEASPEIGGGHAMRCLALADALSDLGWVTEFQVDEKMPAGVRARLSARHALRQCDEVPRGADIHVFDGYGIDVRWERAARGNDVGNVVAIDDLANRRHDVDMLFDASCGRKAEDYDGLLPDGARRFVGPQFALIRSEVAALRESALQRRSAVAAVEKVIVVCGLMDNANLSGIYCRALAKAGFSGSAEIVLGPDAPHRQALETLAGQLPYSATLVVDPPDYAARLAGSDLALGAAGTSALERCVLGLPSVCSRVAENQNAGASSLSRQGAIADIGGVDTSTETRAAAAISALLADGAVRRTMANSAANICDGRGLLRVIGLLSPELARDSTPVTLRPATMDDGERMLDWQREPGVRQHSRNPEPPQRDAHFKWLSGCLRDGSRLLNVIEANGKPAGILRLDPVAGRAGRGNPVYEVSILVSRSRQGSGVAAAALRCARRLVPDADLLAEVLPGNEASHRLFLGAGYVQIDDTHYLHPAGKISNLDRAKP